MCNLLARESQPDGSLNQPLEPSLAKGRGPCAHGCARESRYAAEAGRRRPLSARRASARPVRAPERIPPQVAFDESSRGNDSCRKAPTGGRHFGQRQAYFFTKVCRMLSRRVRKEQPARVREVRRSDGVSEVRFAELWLGRKRREPRTRARRSELKAVKPTTHRELQAPRL